MPATSREPLVDQNGVSPSPNWYRRRTSSRHGGRLADPHRPDQEHAPGPTTRQRLGQPTDDGVEAVGDRDRAGRQVGRDLGEHGPRLDVAARGGLRRLPWARDLRDEPATLDPDDLPAPHLDQPRQRDRLQPAQRRTGLDRQEPVEILAPGAQDVDPQGRHRRDRSSLAPIPADGRQAQRHRLAPGRRPLGGLDRQRDLADLGRLDRTAAIPLQGLVGLDDPPRLLGQRVEDGLGIIAQPGDLREPRRLGQDQPVLQLPQDGDQREFELRHRTGPRRPTPRGGRSPSERAQRRRAGSRHREPGSAAKRVPGPSRPRILHDSSVGTCPSSWEAKFGRVES